jgi:hypothetical protein
VFHWFKKPEKPSPPPRRPGRFLAFVVDDAFRIHGRGLTVTGRFHPDFTSSIRLHDPVELVRPDGTKLKSSVTGIECPTPSPPPEYLGLLLNSINDRSEVPNGTEVWVLVDDTDRPEKV